MATLLYKITDAYKIANANHLQEELDFLKTIFIRHRFDQTETYRVINRGQGRSIKKEEEIKGLAIIPFCWPISNRIIHILVHQNIKTVTRPYLKIKGLMNSVKDSLGSYVPEVYQIPCTCRKIYVCQTGMTITIREHKHKHNLRLGDINKSAIAYLG